MNFINKFFPKIFLRRKCLKINSFSVFFLFNQEKSDRNKKKKKKNHKENQAIIVTIGSVLMAKHRKELV